MLETKRIRIMEAYHLLKSVLGAPTKEDMESDAEPSSGTTISKRKGYFIWDTPGLLTARIANRTYPNISQIRLGTCGHLVLDKGRGFESFLVQCAILEGVEFQQKT